jgi:hypothetical protein
MYWVSPILRPNYRFLQLPILTIIFLVFLNMAARIIYQVESLSIYCNMTCCIILTPSTCRINGASDLRVCGIVAMTSILKAVLPLNSNSHHTLFLLSLLLFFLLFLALPLLFSTLLVQG